VNNKDKTIFDNLAIPVLEALGITVEMNSKVCRFIIEEGSPEEHIHKVASISTLLVQLYEVSLVVGTSISNKNDGINVINTLHKTLLNGLARQRNKIMEQYLDEDISILKKEIS